MRYWISRVWKRWVEFFSKQKTATSFELHDFDYRHYYTSGMLKKAFDKNEPADAINDPTLQIGDLLRLYPGVRDTAVDIGCGAGWISARLSRDFKQVIGIEPSAKAVAMAKEIFPAATHPNIQWRVGFAEPELRALKLTTPTLFLTAVVLSHLLDHEVAAICAALNAAAPVGSIVCLCECWGTDYHRFMWHVRTTAWWQAQLPGWELDFYGPSIENIPDRHKGFRGRKREASA